METDVKIVLAPNAFKGSLSATAAARAIARGVRAALPEARIEQVPVADGGDGLTEVMLEALGGQLHRVRVQGPRGREVDAPLCYVPGARLAAVEMAVASGLTLLPEHHRDPTRASTYGTGQLIAAALDLGAKHIVVGLGGSATTDGGIGMAAALGVRFLDARDQPVEPVGGRLAELARIDASGLDPRIRSTRVEAVCDVDNPLLGERGAARVYAPQKGASPEQVEALEAGLAHLAEVVGRDPEAGAHHLLPGAGAAGGLGFGLRAFLGAQLRRGVDLVLDLVELDRHLEGAALAFTGEGQIDFQTAFGKAPAGVGERAKAHEVPCIALAGSLGERIEALHEVGIDAVFSLCPGPIPLEQAMERGEEYLALVAEQATRAFLAGRRP
jgi:glycerate kinase